jgi:hypothetical protein
MTLDQLRGRATAAETALINTVIKLMEEEIATGIKQKATKFLMANPPPSRDEMSFNREAMSNWAQRFSAALEDEK